MTAKDLLKKRCSLYFNSVLAARATTEIYASKAIVSERSGVLRHISAIGVADINLFRAEKLIVENAKSSDLYLMIKCGRHWQSSPEHVQDWLEEKVGSGTPARFFPADSLSSGIKWDAVLAREVVLFVRNQEYRDVEFHAVAFGQCLVEKL